MPARNRLLSLIALTCLVVSNISLVGVSAAIFVPTVLAANPASLPKEGLSAAEPAALYDGAIQPLPTCDDGIALDVLSDAELLLPYCQMVSYQVQVKLDKAVHAAQFGWGAASPKFGPDGKPCKPALPQSVRLPAPRRRPPSLTGGPMIIPPV